MLKTKPKTIAELNLPQEPIDKTVKNFSKRLKVCVGDSAGHFEHSLCSWVTR